MFRSCLLLFDWGSAADWAQAAITLALTCIALKLARKQTSVSVQPALDLILPKDKRFTSRMTISNVGNAVAQHVQIQPIRFPRVEGEFTAVDVVFETVPFLRPGDEPRGITHKAIWEVPRREGDKSLSELWGRTLYVEFSDLMGVRYRQSFEISESGDATPGKRKVVNGPVSEYFNRIGKGGKRKVLTRRLV